MKAVDLAHQLLHMLTQIHILIHIRPAGLSHLQHRALPRGKKFLGEQLSEGSHSDVYAFGVVQTVYAEQHLAYAYHFADFFGSLLNC